MVVEERNKAFLDLTSPSTIPLHKNGGNLDFEITAIFSFNAYYDMGMNNNIWTLAVGSWGDVFCAYGNMCRLLKEKGQEKCNVVYFGLDKNICEFFKVQPNVDRVSSLDISTPEVIGKYTQLANSDFAAWMDVTELKTQLPDLVPTHISDHFQKVTPTNCYRDFDVVLPPCQGEWHAFLADKKPYILVQPYSTQSCAYDLHWPYWEQVIQWLLEKTDKNIVLVGEMPTDGEQRPEWFPFIEHPRVTNLVGQTKSMTDVLHIATWSESIITTCNSLAYLAILKDIPAVVLCNKIIKDATPYYYNWLNHGRNKLLDWDTSFHDATRAIC